MDNNLIKNLGDPILDQDSTNQNMLIILLIIMKQEVNIISPIF